MLIITGANSYINAQNPNQSRDIPKMPIFQGEDNDFLRYISDNLIYPEIAKTVGLQGEVDVDFTIKANGTVADVKAKNELAGGCDSEAVRVVKLSPKWTPATLYGKTIDIHTSVPVLFQLDKKAINNTIAHLKKSPYGFVFFAGGQVRTLDEMEAKFGKTYDPTTIIDIKKYTNPKFAMPDKQGVYLILMRGDL
jgi:TonB family protein